MNSLLRSLALLLMLVIPTAWAESTRMPLRPAFDAEQRAWLKEHPVLRVGLVQQAPWVVRDQNRQLTGANVELMQRLLEGMGVTPDWRLYPNLGALERAASAGEVDLAPGLQQTPAGLRIWCGSTVETADVAALMPWIAHAFEAELAAQAQAA
mgnify:CR=1 FL=1